MTAHSIWLLPTARTAARAQSIISRICAAQGTEPLQAHVTLLGDLTGSPGRSLAACRRIFAGVPAVPACVGEIGETPDFFTSLFLGLSFPGAIATRRKALSLALQGRPPAPHRPHLSLGYGLDPDFRGYFRKAVQASDIDEDDVIFDQLAIVHSATSIPIVDWKILYRLPLAQRRGTGPRALAGARNS